MFKNIIGQTAAKRRVEFLVKAANQVTNGNLKNKFQPFVLVAPKGTGKTLMARSMAEELKDENGLTRKCLEINGADLKSSQAFVDLVLRLVVDHGGAYTVFIDEAHEVAAEIQNRLLSTFEVSDVTSRTYQHKGEVFEFDLRNVAFILATTNPEKFKDPFYQRLRKVNLKNYKDTEILDIVVDKAARLGLDATNGALKRLAVESRQSPRVANELIDEMVMLQEVNQEKVSLEMWKEHAASMGFIPLGLTSGELKTLESVATSGSIKLGAIAAEIGEDSRTVRLAHEPYLLNRGWIRVDGERHITNSGKKHLAYIKSEQEQVFS